MKKAITIVAGMLFMFVAQAQLSLYAESQNIFNTTHFNAGSVQSYTPVVKMEAIYIKNVVGLNVWGEALRSVPFDSPKDGQFWGQGLVGVAVAPKLKRLDGFVFTASVGLENAPIPARAQMSALIQKKMFNSLTVLEYGGSGYWYLFINTFAVHKNCNVGLYVERYVGIGPRFEVHNDLVTFLVSPVCYDIESRELRANVGLNIFVAK